MTTAYTVTRGNEDGRQGRTVCDVVEAIGMGRAQLQALALTSAVLFANGSQIAMSSITAASIAEQWSLNRTQQSLLITVIFVGMCVGTVVGGQMADRIGRRTPIVFSSLLVSVVGVLSPFAPNWTAFSATRFILGLAMGLGLAPTCALLSEVSPEKWRIAMRSMSDGFFSLGFIYSALLATLDEPLMQSLHWQRLMVWNVAPSVTLGLFSFVFLQESPIFLANVGEHEKAQNVLAKLWHANRDDLTCTRYETTFKGTYGKSTMSQLGALFSSDLRPTMITVSFLAFCLNVYFYGGMYAQPQALKTSSSVMVTGWQMMFGGCFDLAGIAVSGLVATYMDRKTVLVFAMISAVLTITCFGYAAPLVGRNHVLEGVYQFGVYGFYWVPSLTTIALYQFVVETYPTCLASTACGVVMAFGRLGSIVAADLFEGIKALSGRWSDFCYIVAMACIICFFMITNVSEMPMEDPRERDALMSGKKQESSAWVQYGRSAARGP